MRQQFVRDDVLYCSRCKEYKPEGEFYKNKRSLSGFQNYCKNCQKAYSKDRVLETIDERRDKKLQATFGITIKEWNKMYNDQNGCCFICKTHQSDLQCRLHVDHCHKTGKVRALLCQTCNMMLGRIEKDVETAKRMLSYLGYHQ